MQLRTNCDLCHSPSLIKIISNVKDYESDIDQEVDLLQCNRCGLVQQNVLFSNSELANFYKPNYHGRNYSKVTTLSRISSYLRERYYQRFIDQIRRYSHSRSINILDYGSGDGFLLMLLHRAGYKHLYSCDFFPPHRILSSHVTHFEPKSINQYNNKFDIVLMINSVEHLSSFREGMNKITQSMREKSIILIETPNLDSPDYALFRKFWGGLHQPRHTYLWGKNSISEHLSIFGFTTSHIGSPQSAHWAISIQNALSAHFSSMRWLIKNGRIHGYVILVLLVFPLGIIQNLLKHESVLNVVGIRGLHDQSHQI